MIKQGYAYAYTKYPFDSKLMEEFKQYEKEAKEKELGLWSPDACAEVANPTELKTNAPKADSQVVYTTQIQEKVGKSFTWVNGIYFLIGITIMGGISLIWIRKK